MIQKSTGDNFLWGRYARRWGFDERRRGLFQGNKIHSDFADLEEPSLQTLS
jgi:hypothetical protein